MLKCLVIVGVLFAAVPPMPRQAVKSSAQSGDKGKGQSQRKQSASAQALSLVEKAEQTEAAKPNSEPVGSNERAVRRR